MNKASVSLMSEQYSLLLKGSADFEGNSSFTCDGCGLADTYDAFVAEAKERLAHEGQTLMEAKMRDIAKKSRFLKAKPVNPVPEKTFRAKWSSDPLADHR